MKRKVSVTARCSSKNKQWIRMGKTIDGLNKEENQRNYIIQDTKEEKTKDDRKGRRL